MREKLREYELFELFFWIVMVIGLTALFLVVYGLSDKSIQDYTLTAVEETEITPSANGESIETITVNRQLYYKYLTPNKDGGNDTLKVDVEKANLIYIDEDETEKVVKLKRNYKPLDKFLNLLAVHEDAGYEYEIYVNRKIQ